MALNEGSIFDPIGKPNVDKTIERLEHRLAAARQLRLLATEFPDLIEEMFGQGAAPRSTSEQQPQPPQRTPEKPRKTGSNYAMIVQFFLERNNAWTEAPRIGEALGLSRGTVATVLWTTKADRFEKQPVANTVKKKEWRLRPELLTEIKDEVWREGHPLPTQKE